MPLLNYDFESLYEIDWSKSIDCEINFFESGNFFLGEKKWVFLDAWKDWVLSVVLWSIREQKPLIFLKNCLKNWPSISFSEFATDHSH